MKPDRHRALHDAIWSVRRGGTLSIIGVYGGPDPMWPLGELFASGEAWGITVVRRAAD